MDFSEWRAERLQKKTEANDEKTDTPDSRSRFQRDRDRILHSYALRRLAGVTQVVNPLEGHIFHNRLTHTIKVAQIGRRIAEKLLKDYSEDRELIQSLGGLDPEVVEAAALAHDLGHPPFGHIAENCLDQLLRGEGIDEGYEGNAQSFRIVNRLEVRRYDIHGLDLTRATLNATLKYPRLCPLSSEDKLNFGNEKWGVYRTETVEFDWARQSHEDYTPNGHRTLEAAIMDWADDVAYAVHDVEDFYRAGLIPLERLVIDATFDRDEFLDAVAEWRELKPEERDMFNEMLDVFIIFKPYQGTRIQQSDLRELSTRLIHDYVENIAINSWAVENPSAEHLIVGQDDIMRIQVKLLKDLTRYFVINKRSLVTQQYGEQRIIKELFSTYLEATSSRKQASVLPRDFWELFDVEQKILSDRGINNYTEEKLKARLVADVISRMTDEEALRMYLHLTGHNIGSIMENLP